MFWRKRAQDSSVPEQTEPAESNGPSGQDGLADLQKALADAYASKSAESSSQATERSLGSMRDKASKRAESISLDRFPVSIWLQKSNMLERNVLPHCHGRANGMYVFGGPSSQLLPLRRLEHVRETE
ncbi:hypothetical protein KL928_001347 [Ogataea angusta]|uniref:Uncharacterized protein n=1 Tax=Pichia angusta TaxID=870730 RepID=A0AAN6I701_PICAN|nr:uncharacterized protein KL928_001347 [Ogataea angusta]KAG7821263.1 hypothetical protein KL928_001347 [Ogataea angusta]